MRFSFTTEEILSCTNEEQLTALLRQACNREVLYRTYREYGLSYTRLKFCTQEKLAEYLSNELLMLKRKKALRRRESVIDRLSEYATLSLSGATLSGMMILMFVL